MSIQRVAISIFGGLFTGLAEAGLFIIYYNRREKQKAYRDARRKKKAERLAKRHLKTGVGKDEDAPVDKAGSDSEEEGPLRKRVTGKNDKEDGDS